MAAAPPAARSRTSCSAPGDGCSCPSAGTGGSPRRFRGRDVFWWLEKLGRFAQTIDGFPDRRWPPSTVITGVDGGCNVDVRRLAAEGVTVVGRVVGASGNTVAIRPDANRILDEADAAYAGFLTAARDLVAAGIDGDLGPEEPLAAAPPVVVEEVDALDLARDGITAIVWATGYTYDFGWVRIPVFDAHGRPAQQRSVTARPGLYLLGLHWMHTFKSGLFSGVGADAEHLADHISRRSRPAVPADTAGRDAQRRGRATRAAARRGRAPL